MPKVVKQDPNPAPVAKANKNAKSVLDRIGPVEFDEQGIHILLYGRSGTGKTTLASTFPKPLLWMVCSGSKRPGELRSINTPAMSKGISQDVIKKSTEVLELTDYIEQNSGKYKTLVLDHCTGFQDKILAEILGMEELPAQKSWGMAQLQDYGQCTLQAKEAFRRLLGLEQNVVMICQEQIIGGASSDSELSEDASELLRPYVTGDLMKKVIGWLAPSSDYVCQTYIRHKTKEVQMKLGDVIKTSHEKTNEVEYMLRTYPSDTFATKFRVPKGTKIPMGIADPSYAKIMKVINGEPI